MPTGIYPLEKRKNLFKKGHKYLGGGWKKGHIVSEETRQKIRETNIRIGRKPPSNYGHFKDGTSGNSRYVSIHAWMVREKGSPQKCEHCSGIDKKKYEWANIDHKYRRNLDDYIRLCTKCHRKFDKKIKRYLKGRN